MKKSRFTLILLLMTILSIWILGKTVYSSAASYSNEYQQLLEYKVIDWNGTNGVEWYVWDFTSPIHRGFAGTETGGEIIVNITGTHDKPSQLTYLANPDPVPYGDINFYMRTGYLNFTAVNVSNTEMAYILNLGYMSWFPGFMISTDWEINAVLALAQRDSWGILCNITITNKSESVEYDFKQQTGTLLQNTTLEYNITSGVLLRAYTEFGNYWCEIQLQTLVIPGFSLPVVGIVTVITILGISILMKEKKYKK